MIHYTELTLKIDGISLDVEIGFYFHYGSQEVRYYSDGSGQPCDPPEIEIEEITIFSMTTKSGIYLDDHWLDDHNYFNVVQWLMKHMDVDDLYPTLVRSVQY